MKNFDLTASIIFGVATLQGILLVVNLLFQRKGSVMANRLLIAMIVVITLIIFQNFIILSGSYVEVPHLIFLFTSFNGVIGPLFFLYVVFLLNPKRKFKVYDLLHGGLFVYMIYNNYGFLVLEAKYKIATAEYFYFKDVQFNQGALPLLIFRGLLFLAYGLVSLHLIQTKIKEVKDWSANTNLQYLNRFKFINYLFIFYTLLLFTGPLYSFFAEVYIGHYEIYLHIVNSLIVVALAFISAKQPEAMAFILKSKPIVPKPKAGNIPKLVTLKQLMLTEKPYLNQDLKLHDLAKLFDTPPHILSDLINKELNMNFYEFVNTYRVKEFRQRLASTDFNHLTLLAIAYDVGFNSKASFNRIFKKQTGMTPSQYSNQLVVSTSQVESKTI